MAVINYDRNGKLITDWSKVYYPPEFVEALARLITRGDEIKAKRAANESA